MAWVKLDDQFFRHPKVLDAGRDARDLYLAALCYCGSGLTDGVIPASSLRMLSAEAEIDNASQAAGRLVAVGLWEQIENGYRVHDYYEYQPTKEQVLITRKARVEAGAKGGKQKASNLLEDGLAKPKQNPSKSLPRIDTRLPTSSDEDELGAKAPADLPPDEPLANDALVTNGRTAGDVYALVDAFADGKGLARADIVGKARKTAYNALAHAPPWVAVEDVRHCTAYFMTDPFWDQPRKLTAQIVVEGLPEWRKKGKPAVSRPPQRNGRAEITGELDHDKYRGANYLKARGS